MKALLKTAAVALVVVLAYDKVIKPRLMKV